MIRAHNLSKKFGFTEALSNVSFTLEQGQFAALLGVNGAGKTTLVRILSTLSRASTGEVQMAGLDAYKKSLQVRRLVGVMSHLSFLYPELTAVENLQFYAAMYRVPHGGQRVNRLLQDVGLAERRFEPVRTFSRGMQQRLALARAVLHQPKILLLDEPFAGLDINATAFLTEMVRDSVKKGVTVLLTTHFVDFALREARRILVLRRGELVLDAETAGLGENQIKGLLKS